MDAGLVAGQVDRRRLDFDFEKICSVTLSPVNVYACLTCGKYFQGRARNSLIHIHSLQEEHPLCISLETKRVYQLPENRELVDARLDDIRYAIYPTFSAEDLAALDQHPTESVDLHGRRFTAGYIGLNNIKANDYANVLLQALVHVRPVRDLFLARDFQRSPSKLLQTLGEAARKIWSPRPFKALYSPHEFMQAVSLASDRRFSLDRQADVLDFLAWLLNALGQDLQAHGVSLIADAFQGRVQVSSGRMGSLSAAKAVEEQSFTTRTVPFLYLSLDLPATPLYQSSTGDYIVPQVSLDQLLAKYDGGQLTHRGDTMQAFALERLPPYLILHFRRFVKSHLVVEKNRTLVSHPLSGLVVQNVRQEESRYNLVANVCHAGGAELGKGHFFVQVLQPATQHWLQMHDLDVREIPALNVPLSDSYVQIWERSPAQA